VNRQSLQYSGRERNDPRLATLRQSEDKRPVDRAQLSPDHQHHAFAVDVVRGQPQDLALPQPTAGPDDDGGTEQCIDEPLVAG
jgi:hypothetical protein